MRRRWNVTWRAGGLALLLWASLLGYAWAQEPTPIPPIQETRQAGDLTIGLNTMPAVGQQGVVVHVTNQQGQPIDQASVRLDPLMRDMVMVTTPITMVRAAPGRYDGRVDLNMAGRWDLQVTVTRPGAEPVQATFELTAALGRVLPKRPPSEPIYPSFFSGWSITGINGLLIALIMLAALRWAIQKGMRRYREFARGLAVVSLLLCLIPYGVALASMPEVVGPEQAQQRAAELFAKNCLPCHGAQGRGDGPAARSLNPRPADLTADHVAIHPDGQIYTWIEKGFPGSAMPAFSQLSSDEIWWLVDYVRSLRAARGLEQP